MKRKNVFSIKLLSTAIVLSITAFSCNNNDTSDSSVTGATDTSAPMAMDASKSMMDTTKDPGDIAPGTAKPNPAKKGMKGKVTVVETIAPAASKPAVKIEADNNGVYSSVEIIPSFPGGNKGLQKFFDDNLEYPADASNDGVEGTVNVTFVVDENGKLTSPKIQGDNLGYGLEAEALRVVNKMPTWNPGKLKGKNVKTNFTLPIRFVLY